MKTSEINELLLALSENLRVELKSWLDLSTLDHQAKVARALIALRNQDGGFLVLGFDDKNLKPLASGRPADIRSAYHADKIQGIVKDFIEPPFEVKVHFGERDGLEFPVIEIGPGVTSPVVARKPGVNLKQHAVYMRTVHNGVVESTEPRSGRDWDALMRICFDNREADVGRFFRRHLSAIVREIQELPGAGSPTAAIFEGGSRAYVAREKLALANPKNASLGNRKGWREIAVVVQGDLKPIQPAVLLNELFPRHPRLSGWPVWIDSRGLAEQNLPYPVQGGWEAFVLLDWPDFAAIPMIDFWHLEAKGKFYHRRTYEDDVWAKLDPAARGKVIDFPMTIQRVAEALGTAWTFAQQLAADPDRSSMIASVKWSNLRGRVLLSWSEPARDIWGGTKAYEDAVTSEVQVPLGAARTALAPYVDSLVQPLFAIFGANLPPAVVQEIALKVLKASPM